MARNISTGPAVGQGVRHRHEVVLAADARDHAGRPRARRRTAAPSAVAIMQVLKKRASRRCCFSSTSLPPYSSLMCEMRVMPSPRDSAAGIVRSQSYSSTEPR
jgi:hypothetical protein